MLLLLVLVLVVKAETETEIEIKAVLAAVMGRNAVGNNLMLICSYDSMIPL